MKKYILLTSLLLSAFISKGQCPTEIITITTQLEIDNFAATYPNCTQLEFELIIDGSNNTISNINGLSEITHAQDIFITTTAINDFVGLDNLVEVADISLWFNSNLQNMEGFTSLQHASGLELLLNHGVINLSGLNSIQSIESINFFGNSNLADISQLSFLTSMTSLELRSNALSSLTGLENLQSVTGDFLIAGELIENFNDLASIDSIGGSLYLMDNDFAENLTAFSNIISVFDLYVIDCSNLKNLAGLQNLQVVENSLRIGFNSNLLDLSVFNNIESVNRLDVYGNENLLSLRGLENLDIIQERLLITNNPQLISIEQIENVDPSLIDEVAIINNMNLSICNNLLICAIIDDDTVIKSIALNDTGCNSVEEVLESCFLSAEDHILNEQIEIYPNPVSNILTLNISNNIELKNVSVYTILGQRLIETNDALIDFSSYSNGVYFLKILTDKGSLSKKIIKK